MRATELSNSLSSLSKLQELQDLINSPYQLAIREMQERQTYLLDLTSPLIDIARDYAKYNNMARGFQYYSARSMAAEMLEQQQSIATMMKSMVESSVSSFGRQMQEEKASVESSTLMLSRMLQEQLTRSFALEGASLVTADLQKMFSTTFLTSSLVLQAHSASLIAAIDDDIFDHDFEVDDQRAAELLIRFKAVVRYIVEYLARLSKKHKPSFWEVLGITLAVYALFDSNVGNDVTRSMLKEEIAKSEQRIISAVVNENNSNYSNDCYVVSHPTSIKVKPTHQSAKIASVYKNQLLSIISRQKEWAYVQYFDFIEGLPKTGWIAKKYLTKVKVRS